MTQDTKSNTATVDAVRTLATARARKAALDAELKAAREHFDFVNQALIATSQTANGEVEQADRTLRALAIADFQATGDKNPAPGVSISEATALEYDLAAVTEWAKTAMPDLITPPQLNVKAFDKIARVVPLSFVTKAPSPSVKIASDLEAALVGVEQERAA